MNLKQQEQTLTAVEKRDPSLPALIKVAKPMGTFAGKGDFVLRIHEGTVAPANTGDQGGGQN